jgi:hypothetical protein
MVIICIAVPDWHLTKKKDVTHLEYKQFIDTVNNACMTTVKTLGDIKNTRNWIYT